MGTVIEAGHMYTCTGPTNVSERGWQIGKDLANGIDGSVLALFIDDYNKKSPFSLPGEAPAEPGVGARIEQEADHVFYESVFAAQSLAAVKEMLDNGNAKLRAGDVSVCGVLLGKLSLVEDKIDPKCVLMDYLLVRAKAEIGGDQVVVLPSSYQKEQRQLITVLAKLIIPELSSYTATFFDLDSGVVGKMNL